MKPNSPVLHRHYLFEPGLHVFEAHGNVVLNASQALDGNVVV